MDINWLAVGAFGLGAFAKLILPWLLKRYRDPDAPDSKWNWRYFWPQLVAFAIVVLVVPILTPNIEAINLMPPFGAYLAGWGLGDQAKTLILDTGLVPK